ncbi:hypothetical protein HPP92_025992 [Vanilla planifolia]|uniref:Uncharacterized protein n=1 Tax=Vanilla planifolia TaxID=51239 RepID=A0A835UA75_VANPL|nr:hypothetical protein HPP92_025992 [Vanilla planifolia]
MVRTYSTEVDRVQVFKTKSFSITLPEKSCLPTIIGMEDQIKLRVVQVQSGVTDDSLLRLPQVGAIETGSSTDPSPITEEGLSNSLTAIQVLNAGRKVKKEKEESRSPEVFLIRNGDFDLLTHVYPSTIFSDLSALLREVRHITSKWWGGSDLFDCLSHMLFRFHLSFPHPLPKVPWANLVWF